MGGCSFGQQPFCYYSALLEILTSKATRPIIITMMGFPAIMIAAMDTGSVGMMAATVIMGKTPRNGRLL